MQVLGADAGGDICGGGDGFAGTWAVRNGLAARVNTGPEAGGGDGFRPGEEIRGLFGKQAATLFLIEEEKRAWREVLSLGGGDGVGCVGAAEDLRADACVFDLGVEATVPEHKEAEASLDEDGAMAGPGVAVGARWRVEPIADKAEVLSKRGQRGLTGEGVAIEAKVSTGG